MTLNHPEIEEKEVLERYLRKELAPAELELFEEHLLTCEDCLAELEAEERFGRGLRSLAAAEDLPAPPRRALGLAWAASILLALLPAWLLHRDGELTRRQLEEQHRSAVAEQQEVDRQAEALRAEVDTLRRDLERATAATGSLETAGDRRMEELNQELAESRRHADGLRRQLEQATRPQAGVALLRLDPVRSGGEEASHRLSLSSEPEWVVLVLEPSLDTDVFHAVIEGPGGIEVWRRDGLELDAYGQLVISLYSPQLKVGLHRILLEAEGGGGRLESAFEVRR